MRQRFWHFCYGDTACQTMAARFCYLLPILCMFFFLLFVAIWIWYKLLNNFVCFFFLFFFLSSGLNEATFIFFISCTLVTQLYYSKLKGFEIDTLNRLICVLNSRCVHFCLLQTGERDKLSIVNWMARTRCVHNMFCFCFCKVQWYGFEMMLPKRLTPVANV